MALAGKLFFHKPWPSANGFVRECLISVGSTIVITLAISLVLAWAGFSESQFYRPSTKDYAEHTKLGLTPEEVSFKSKDGTRLHGWFMPGKDQPIGTVIHLHGSDRNITSTIKNSYWLTDNGFNLFLFDYRGYGKSEGQSSQQGVIEDAIAAIEYVRSRSDLDADKIGLWGQSMGGQLAIVAADRVGKQGIRAVVVEATYASHSHHVKDKMAQMGPLWLIQWAVWLTTADACAAQNVVGRIAPTPILFVHGTADRGVQPYHSEWLFNAAGHPKDIWRIQGARHLQVFQDAHHREKLVQFFKQSLQPDATSGGEMQLDKTTALDGAKKNLDIHATKSLAN